MKAILINEDKSLRWDEVPERWMCIFLPPMMRLPI